MNPKAISYRGIAYPSITACVKANIRHWNERIICKAIGRINDGWTVNQAMTGLTVKRHKIIKRDIISKQTVTVNGKRVKLRSLLKDSGVSERQYRKRVARGWAKVDAATAKPGEGRTRRRIENRFARRITVFGETHTISEWERIKGLSKGVIKARLEKGWTAEEAIGIANTRVIGHYIHPRDHGERWHTAKNAGVNINTVIGRMRNGETLEEAVSRPASNPHELMAKRDADIKRRELAKLGIII